MSAPGSLEVVVGPMFSGKTEALIDRFHRATADGQVVIAIKPVQDSRHAPDRLVSHSGREIDATAVSSTDELELAVESADAVLIDEVQFLDPSLVALVEDIRKSGRHVVAAGLDLDFRRDPFPTTLELVRRASVVSQRAAVCTRCGLPATLTQRLVSGRPAPLSGSRILVGDRELYEPRCERCWLEERQAVEIRA